MDVEKIRDKLTWQFPRHSWVVEVIDLGKGNLMITTDSWLSEAQFNRVYGFLAHTFIDEFPEVQAYQLKHSESDTIKPWSSHPSKSTETDQSEKRQPSSEGTL